MFLKRGTIKNYVRFKQGQLYVNISMLKTLVSPKFLRKTQCIRFKDLNISAGKRLYINTQTNPTSIIEESMAVKSRDLNISADNVHF